MRQPGGVDSMAQPLEIKLVYRSARWRAARAAALERDRHRCIGCRTGSELTVHHILELDDGGAPFDLDNLETLCAPLPRPRRRQAVRSRPEASLAHRRTSTGGREAAARARAGAAGRTEKRTAGCSGGSRGRAQIGGARAGREGVEVARHRGAPRLLGCRQRTLGGRRRWLHADGSERPRAGSGAAAGVRPDLGRSRPRGRLRGQAIG